MRVPGVVAAWMLLLCHLLASEVHAEINTPLTAASEAKDATEEISEEQATTVDASEASHETTTTAAGGREHVGGAASGDGREVEHSKLQEQEDGGEEYFENSNVEGAAYAYGSVAGEEDAQDTHLQDDTVAIADAAVQDRSIHPHDADPAAVKDTPAPSNESYSISLTELEARASSSITTAAVAGGGAADEGAAPSPEQKKKVPLREILLRLKPASLMDEEEREAAAAAERTQQEQQDSVVVVAGSAVSVEPVLHGNARVDSSKSSSNRSASSSRRAVCAPADTPDSLQLLNSTGLKALVSPNPNISTRSVAAPCVLMFFFSSHCQFSVAATPHILAMSRGLQGFMPVYAINSVDHHSINSQYGVMGTPTLLLFHNGHSVAQYNASSYTADLLSSFIRHYTDYTLEENFSVSDDDLETSPLPLEVTPGSALWLLSSWVFLLSVSCYCFLRSAFCNRIVEAVLNNWREAEAHQHQE